MSEQIKVTCTQCGKTLEIPAELEEFSCLYCGQRLYAAQLFPCGGEADYRAELDYLAENLPKTVTRYADYYKKITKDDFEPAFEAYEQGNAEILAHIDLCAAANPAGKEAAVQEICKQLLDSIDLHMMSDKRWPKKAQRGQLLFETKVILAIFLTTLVKKLELENAERFRSELHRQWMERYPKENWLPGDYETMVTGFKRRKWCFITTATCRYEGKPDDCAELTAFRAFRDGWLRQSEGGEELIDLYYTIAPGIVACIDYCDTPAERYGEIRTRWLAPCYSALNAGHPEECRARYTDMIRTLKERYYLA